MKGSVASMGSSLVPYAGTRAYNTPPLTEDTRSSDLIFQPEDSGTEYNS